MQTLSSTGSNSQFGFRPLALSDDRHDSCPHPARCLFERLVRRALLVVKVVIAVVLEDGLRHNGVALAERGRNVEDFARGVGYNVGFAILYAIRDQYRDAMSEECRELRKGDVAVSRTLFASFFKTSYACNTFAAGQPTLPLLTVTAIDSPDQCLQALAP